MSTRLRPLGRRVILRKIEAGSRGGISVPKSIESEEHTQAYEVVARPQPIVDSCLVMGDKVYLARHKGYKIDRDGEELYVADVDDLLAVEEEAE